MDPVETTPKLAQQLLCWSYGEGDDDARRGHVYLHADGERVRLCFFEHRPDRDPAAHQRMMDRHGRWTRAHPPTPEEASRRRFNWRTPGERWSFFGDLGGVREVLGDREVEVVLGPGVGALPSLPIAFLRRPVTTLVEHVVGPVRWPPSLEAGAVCVGAWPLLGIRHGQRVIVCAARYGSKFASCGQDRTAAIWRSYDGGASWSEMPWTIKPTVRQRVSGTLDGCWPPEQVLRIYQDDEDDEDSDDGGLTIEWDDPWIDWEPGTQWQARWDPTKERWSMSPRPGGGPWP